MYEHLRENAIYINIFVVYLQKRAYNDTYHIHVYSLITTEMYRSPHPSPTALNWRINTFYIYYILQ